MKTEQKKNAKRWAVSVVLVMVVAACGGETSTAPVPAPVTPAPQPVTPEPENVDPLAEARAFYSGAIIDFVVGTGTGGGYDSYARLLAPCLSEKTGARIDVRNEPGAGGLVAMNNLLRARPDGLSIGFMNGPGNVSAFIAQLEGARFDMSQFAMIARYTGGATLIATSNSSGFNTWDDVLAADRRIIWGTTGIGSASHLNSLVVARVFDPGSANQIVPGFSGSAEAELALLRGEIDILSGGLDSRLQAIEQGDAIPLLLIDDKRDDRFPDVPHILEFDRFSLTADQQSALRNHVAVNALDRILVTPGALPADRLAFLEETVRDCLTEDDDFRETAQAQNRWDAIAFLSSEDLTKQFNEALNPNAVYRELVIQAFEP